MTTDAPRKATFETTELLENILSFLPPKTLFGVQRVSRKFKDVIEKSIRLQQKMFLRSCSGEKQRWAPVRVEGTRRDFTFALASSAAAELSRPKAVTPVQLSFLFDDILTFDDYKGSHSATRSVSRTGCERVQAVSGFPNLRGRGSWLDTLITDPPSCKVTVLCIWKINQQVDGWVQRDAENQAGLTIRDLMTALLDVKDTQKPCSGNSWVDHDTLGNFEEVTLASVLEELEAKYRREAKFGLIQLLLPDLVVPTEKEWDEMRQASVESV